MSILWRARRLVPTSLLASALLVAAPVASAASGANELMLINAQTGKCLTIAGGVSTQNNVEALQFDCDSHPSRRWTLRVKL